MTEYFIHLGSMLIAAGIGYLTRMTHERQSFTRGWHKGHRHGMETGWDNAYHYLTPAELGEKHDTTDSA